MKIFVVLSLLSFSLLADMSIKDAWKSIEVRSEGVKASSSDVTRAELKKSSAESMYLPRIISFMSNTSFSKVFLTLNQRCIILLRLKY